MSNIQNQTNSGNGSIYNGDVTKNNVFEDEDKILKEMEGEMCWE